MSTLKISLLQNAYGFIEEALSKAIKAEEEPLHWKFAALNLVQAIELSLKEKLRREHPILIFQNVDSPKNTVSLEVALKRLQKIGKINFSESDISTISKASKIRNMIVHFEFDLNAKKFKLIFAKLLGFLSQFHTIHLDSTLDEIIPGDLWQEAVSIFEYSEELFKRAEKIFEEQGIDVYYIWTCANCGWDAFVIQDDINICYVCGYKAEIIECPDCKEFFYHADCYELQTGDERYEHFCNNCYEERISNDERYYYEMMSHFHYK